MPGKLHPGGMSAALRQTTWTSPGGHEGHAWSAAVSNDNALPAHRGARQNSRLGISLSGWASLLEAEPANQQNAPGNLTAPQGLVSAIGITGKEEDVEVGLQYFGKRYLNPLLGRWISADPLAVHAPGQADLNVYAYVSGSVLKNVDPLGLEELAASKLRGAFERKTRVYEAKVEQHLSDIAAADEAAQFHRQEMLDPNSDRDFETSKIWADYWEGESSRLSAELDQIERDYQVAKEEFSKRYDEANTRHMMMTKDRALFQVGDRRGAHGRMVTGDEAMREERTELERSSLAADQETLTSAGPAGQGVGWLAKIANFFLPEDMQIDEVNAMRVAEPVDKAAQGKAGPHDASNARFGAGPGMKRATPAAAPTKEAPAPTAPPNPGTTLE